MTSRLYFPSLLVPLLLALGLGACSDPESVNLVVATGSEAGTNHALGSALARIASRDVAGMTMRAETSAGSVENMRRLESGGADLAIVQNDTAGNGKIRTVAVLFEEVLHLLVRTELAGEIKSLADLRDRKISVGPSGSGTAAVTREILDHFKISSDDEQALHLPMTEAIAALRSGEVDAIFILAAAPFAEAERLLDENVAKLVALGDANLVGSKLDGIRAANPYLSRAVIAAATYGEKPARPVGTVAVKALLAATSDVEAGAIKRLTETLFESKVELAESHSVAAFLDESFDAAAVRFPIHDGAASYYRRDEPGFFVEYAEAISLCLTLLVGLGSGLLALREWLKRRKKNRIDRYYGEIEAVSRRTPEASPSEATELIEVLQDVRRRAFGELMLEKLEADSSFVIFQDYLMAELRALEARRGDGPASP